ncbi:MAG: dimethyl sulfoxide reductase subunit A [Halioglobus sp.]|nr:dimethyl sulfoxide reductase subunit A [Halioglobus sp.]
MDRREFLKLSATAGAVSAVSACGGGSGSSQTVTPPPAPPAETTNFSSCLVNCGSNCPLRIVSSEGRIVRVETDYTVEDNYGQHQVRACLRGRSIKQRTYAPDRLKNPLKRRAGAPRGSGDFEEISWEQAIAEIADKVTALRAEHGPRSIYHHYGSGAYYGFSSSSCIQRALRLSGGHLGYYGNYSWAALEVASPATYGTGGTGGTYLSEVANSDLLLGFGFNPWEIRMSGSGEQWDLINAMESRQNNGLPFKFVLVDPRYTDSNVGKADEWVPIRPGTDAALAEAIAYEMISSGWVDENSREFLDDLCIGYDRASLEQAKIDNPDYADVIDPDENYLDYILGQGKFSEPKTPEWAAAITGVPAAAIRSLAQDVMNAESPYIITGAGCNRQANGEDNMRSLYMLPILTGKIGNPGVNNGELPRNFGLSRSGMSSGSNPVGVSIPFHVWAEAIENGADMSEKTHSVRGLAEGETIGTNIKAVFSSSGNALINQHSDINETRRILQQEDLCELIVVTDCWMTSSAKFADYVLPGSTWVESNDLANDSYASGLMGYITFMSTSLESLYNTKNLYNIGLELARRWGVEEAYTEGRTEDEWLEYLYQGTRESNPDLGLPPTYAEAQKIGFFRKFAPGTHIALQDYVQGNLGGVAAIGSSSCADPDDHDCLPRPAIIARSDEPPRLETPSGKIEIYSLDWARKASEWIPASDEEIDQIRPLAKYIVPWQGYEDAATRDEFPFQVVGYHTKGRTHSSYHNVPNLREAVEDATWINPLDARRLGIEPGQMVTLTSPRGSLRTRAKITPRIIPGVVSMAEGAWYSPRPDGVDEGGCTNTLTNYRPMPVSKGNPQHTIRVRITV